MFRNFIYSLLLSITTLASAQAGIMVVNGLTHTYQIGADTYYKGVITIQNTSSDLQDVKLFKRDYSYRATGEMFYGAPDLNKRTNADWITLNTTFLTLKGKEKVDVVYEIKVPKDVVLQNGAYWSVIMVEPVARAVPSDEKSGFQITSKVRYAVQIITTYNEPAAITLLKFEDVGLNAEENRYFLEVDMANNGELFHRVRMHVEIFDGTTGNAMGAFSSEKLSLLPKSSKRFGINLGDLPSGIYRAVLTAETDNDNVFGLQMDLDLKHEE